MNAIYGTHIKTQRGAGGTSNDWCDTSKQHKRHVVTSGLRYGWQTSNDGLNA